MTESEADVVDLLQGLIRNACVNDGAITSGGEARNIDLLESVIAGDGIDIERFEPFPGRANLVARLSGSDPKAPSLALMAHADVVPVSEDRWRRDPFGGELIDGEVWGRGAVDMLNLTSSMAIAFKRLARQGFRPRGDLLYIAVADEETGGEAGAKWLVEHEPDAIRTDYLLTEFGGMRVPTAPPDRPTFPVAVAEKGANWVKIRFRGTPGHASLPLGTDNALVKASTAVQRLAEFSPRARTGGVWGSFVDGLGLPDDVAAALKDPDAVEQMTTLIPDPALQRLLNACTHTTIAPTMLHAGVKTNVIPDFAEIEADVRVLPGEGPEDIDRIVREALGDLAGDAEVEITISGRATSSPEQTPLWESLRAATARMVPGARTIPMLLAGATDSRFFRTLDTVCYGFGLYSNRLSFAEFGAMFHGDDERIDVESLAMTTDLWEAVATDLLG
ncbi:MAG TPA: M20/M25/M40 family metallo-hydrolase [Actinomycetota bacterium]